uniref:Uncharacterized protein n=1 Tax=Kalanchoe fedtschenkoi TaxID=63787 RepID=A0A7N0TNV1_KALFE
MSQQSAQLKPPAATEKDEGMIHANWICGLPSFINFMNVAIELNLFDIISRSDTPLTATEIATHLPKHNPEETPDILDRMLCLFATFSLLDCTTETVEISTGVTKERRFYKISQTGKYFSRNTDGRGGSIVPMFMQQLDPVVQNIRHTLKDAIMEGVNPCQKAYGMPMFQVLSQHPASNEVFNTAMTAVTTIMMRIMLETYDGFNGIKLLVDAGGGTGTCLKSIISANPHIRGINFDLPHVIRNAPPTPGITHVEGDFLVGIPKGDAIMLKNVLHNWDDEHCLKVLKNCYQAIPDKGKVIVIDPIKPTVPTTEDLSKLCCLLDCIMYHLMGAKERSKEELFALARAAGFSETKLVCFVAGSWVMEFHK